MRCLDLRLSLLASAAAALLATEPAVAGSPIDRSSGTSRPSSGGRISRLSGHPPALGGRAGSWQSTRGPIPGAGRAVTGRTRRLSRAMTPSPPPRASSGRAAVPGGLGRPRGEATDQGCRRPAESGVQPGQSPRRSPVSAG